MEAIETSQGKAKLLLDGYITHENIETETILTGFV